VPYLQTWGPEWKRRAPFRLFYYTTEQPTPEQPALVVLSQVLADGYNIGYQEQRFLVLQSVNHRRISHLTDLREALKCPVNGFHILDFAQGESLQRMVLAAGDAEKAATRRVLESYGIAEPFRLNGN
jgi:hypothetical protein